VTQAFGIEQHRSERKKKQPHCFGPGFFSGYKGPVWPGPKKTFFSHILVLCCWNKEWMLMLGLFAASVLTLTRRNPIAIQLAGYSEILAQLLNIVEMEMVGNLLAKRQCKREGWFCSALLMFGA